MEFLNDTPPWEDITATYDFGLASWQISLHTANPYAVSEVSDQTTSETSYTGYGRVAVARNSTEWAYNNSDPANPFIYNVNAIVFGQNTSGSTVNITHVGIGTAASSTGYLAFAMQLESTIALLDDTQFAIAAGALKIWRR